MEQQLVLTFIFQGHNLCLDRKKNYREKQRHVWGMLCIFSEPGHPALRDGLFYLPIFGLAVWLHSILVMCEGLCVFPNAPKCKKKISSKQMSLPTVCACISLALRVSRSLFLLEPSFYTGNCGYCVCMLQHVFCALMLMSLKQLRSMSKQPNTSPKPLWLLIKRMGSNE